MDAVGGFLFWGSVLTLAWVFAGFPVTVGVWGAIRRARPRQAEITPSVSLLIAAHNEERHIERKIRNALALDYRADRLEILVASDGSTDATEEIVRKYEAQGVRLLALPRGGKIAALDALVGEASGGILVFTDANTLFAKGAVRKLVRSFVDTSVGGVSGNQVHRFAGDEDSIGRGESLYWKYDKWLKARESETGSIVSADGAIYAIRKTLYRKPPPHVNDDFVISASVVQQGSRLVFESEAIAWEPPMGQARDEFTRKVRILSRGWWSVLSVRSLLNPFRHGFYSLTLFSHKILRRLTPVMFLGTLTGSLLLAGSSPAFLAVALGHGLLLGLAGLGAAQRNAGIGRTRLLSMPFFFCLANYAALVGLYQVLRGRKVATWQPRGRGGFDEAAAAARRRTRARRRAALTRVAWFVGALVFAFAVAAVQQKLGSLLVPVLGIAAAVAGAGLFLYPRVGAVLFIALAFANVPVLVGRAVGDPWVAGAVASVLVALPAFVQIYVLKRGWILDRPLLLMFAFLGALLLSTLVARDYGIAGAWIGTFVVEGLLMYVLLVNAIRGKGGLRAAVWTLAIVATVLTGLGVYQEIAHDYTNDFGGLAQRKLKRWDPNEVGSTGLIREREKVSAADRIGGPVNDPNHFAQLLIVVLPMSFMLMYSERRRAARLAALVATLVLLGGVMLTYSRGAFLVLVGLIILVTGLGYLRWRQLIVGTVGILLLTAVVAPGYFDRMDTIRRVTQVKSDTDDWQSGDHAVRGRLTEMLAAIHVFIDHPILGVGPGQYTPFYSLEYMNLPGVAFKQLDVERRAHTLYMELAAETGLVGLTAFLAIAGLILLRLWSLRRRWIHERPEYAHLATGIALAILAYLGTGVFLSLAFQRYYWMLIALGGVASQVLAFAEARDVAPSRPAPRVRRPKVEPMGQAGAAL